MRIPCCVQIAVVGPVRHPHARLLKLHSGPANHQDDEKLTFLASFGTSSGTSTGTSQIGKLKKLLHNLVHQFGGMQLSPSVFQLFPTSSCQSQSPPSCQSQFLAKKIGQASVWEQLSLFENDQNNTWLQTTDESLHHIEGWLPGLAWRKDA